MSNSQAVSKATSIRTANPEIETQKPEQRDSMAVSLVRYALVGAAAVFLITLIEWIDVNIKLTPVFESFSERVRFSAYMSINLLDGLLIGLFVGLFAHAASLLKRTGQRLLAFGGEARLAHKLIAGVGVAAVAAFLLNQQPSVNRYMISLIREAEKISFLNQPLLNHERASSYLILMGLIIVCSLIWMISRASKSMSRSLVAAWSFALALVIGAAYYVNSRIEIQLYDNSLHRSMFITNITAAIALISTLYLSSPRIRSLWPSLKAPLRKTIGAAVAIIFLASVAFTFARFDSNQNLKTQLFYRTSQTKQYFKLIAWALDRDRDGYSPYLGGGDSDDTRADINPGQPDIVGDNIDNNLIGGDLTKAGIEDWQNEHNSLHVAANPQAKRLNVIYIFIDALRADHLGLYGYNRNTSPNFDKLGARSSVFENAYTPAPNTFEALPKFMESSYWDGHFKSWSQVFADNDYNAFLFPRRLPTMLRHIKGMRVVNHKRSRRLKDTIDVALEEFSKTPSDRPFCAYLYATDPHREYLKHEDFNFGPGLADLYDGEIAYTDAQFGRLFDWMEQTGRMKDTVIVMMADHGESLGERGVYKHSSQLYNEQAHVPMIIYVPDLAPRRIPDYVSTIDLGPTMLNIVGIEPPKEWHGVSVLPLMRGEAFTHPPIYGEQTMKQASPYVKPEQNVNPETKKYMVITQDGYKLIYNRNYYCFELFNLKADPGELHNLYDYMPEKSAEMKKLLGRYIDILTVMRPWDADETQYFWGNIRDDVDM